MLIRSGKSLEEFAEVIDDKFLFIDKAGNLVHLVNEGKILAREIAKYNERFNYYFLDIELDPLNYETITVDEAMQIIKAARQIAESTKGSVQETLD